MGEAAQRQAEQPRRGGVILCEGVDLLFVRLAQIKVVDRYRQIVLTHSLAHPDGREDAKDLVVAPLAKEVTHERQQPCRLWPRQLRRRLQPYVMETATPSMWCSRLDSICTPYVTRLPAGDVVERAPLP